MSFGRTGASVDPRGLSITPIHILKFRVKRFSIDTPDSSGDLSALTQMDLSMSLVECMKTPGLNGDSDHLNHNTLELKLKQEDEQLEREYDYLKLEQQDSEIRTEIHLYKEEEDKNSIWVETKTEADAGTDGTLLVFEENDGGTEGTAWLIQCPELLESLKTAMLGASSVVRQEEVDATSHQSQKDNTILDRMETNQQDTEAEEEADDVDVETPETESGDQTEISQQDVAPGLLRHQCELCGKSFARKSNVIRHQQHNCSRTRTTADLEQTEQERFSCRKCSLTFDTKCGLKLHKLCHKENSEKPRG
ncbi:zinc finger and SCAN domain-containing protein 26-like [Archocentrus centrarchus]|uniref:zinc finger and SCAN domain-containing protein 26-like n=1 Tax=Archocentrus centrarchus TaxID=63155 RepID=UPI0011EA383F|nr:zinc finger and SCAN domain-containing protein 26-like [Archocentrus centrarchus]